MLGPAQELCWRALCPTPHLLPPSAHPPPHSHQQVASKAQKASVEPEEVARYEAYNERHGAKLAAGGGGEAGDEEDDW